MPKEKLTKTFIDSLPQRASGQIIYSDTELPGFYLIVGRQSKTFAVQKDIRGKAVRYTIGKYGHFALEQARIPVLLDPCNQHDVALIAFDLEGQPVIDHEYKNDHFSCYRLEQSNLILNLDYPTFKEDRQKLRLQIEDLIKIGNNCADGSMAQFGIQQQLRDRMAVSSPYSRAAECYIREHRHKGWVEEIL